MTGPRKRRWSLINGPCWNDGLAAQGVRSMWDMYIDSIRDDLGEGTAKSGVCVACTGWLKIIRRVLWPSWPSSLACAWQVETQIELMIGPLVDLEKLVFPIANCICFGHGFKIIIFNSHRRGSCGTQVVFMSHCTEM